MPTYEYRCKDCGQQLDVVQSFTDESLTTCEACGGPLRKLFGNVGIAFKGSGFYKNDSRSSANGAKQEKKDKDKKEEPAAATTTSDTKSGDSASAGSSESAKPAKASAPTAAP